MAKNVTGGNIALSLIDVLASALGAAVLLFVILASTPTTVASRAQACGTFVRYEWTVTGGSEALLRLMITAPNTERYNIVELSALDGGPVVESHFPGVRSATVFGFSPSAAQNTVQDRHFVLRLNQPAEGTWKIGVLYYGRAKRSVALPPDITISSRVYADSAAMKLSGSSLQTVVDNFNRPSSSHGREENVSLGFGTALMAPEITVGGDKANIGCS